MRPLFILNVAALSPQEIGEDTPHLLDLAERGSLRPLEAPEPALTSVSHATMITGLSPRDHGVVANGWYDPRYAKIMNWNRSDHVVSGEKLWEAARRRDPQVRSANLFWRFCTHATCDLTLTERPTYFANGRKGADVYSSDPDFKSQVVAKHGAFPFFHFWGPKAGMPSSAWISEVARGLIQAQEHQLILCYAPGLDYEGQRFGPKSNQAREALRRGDALFGALIKDAQEAGYDVAVVSDYGFTEVHRPIFLNRVLRRAGMLTVEPAVNGELLEPGASRAFAVSDNQAAHIYIRDPNDVEIVARLLSEVDGVSEVLDASASEALGHSRSGRLLAIAEPDAWFAYPYWLDDDQAPDFARCVDIFNKPGFDPCEMFLREGLGGVLHAAKRFAQLKLGIRAPFDVISTRYDRVRGARNIRPQTPEEGATLITSWRQSQADSISMSELSDLWLARMFDVS